MQIPDEVWNTLKDCIPGDRIMVEIVARLQDLANDCLDGKLLAGDNIKIVDQIKDSK